MGRKLQTIYEYFNNYSEQEINDIITKLPLEEKSLLKDRYGNDLHKPTKNEIWTKEKEYQFYKKLLPKIKKILEKNLSPQYQTIDLPEITLKIEPELNNKIQLLLQLINQNKCNNEICEILNITPQQLYSILLELKNKGIMLSRKYYSNGTIKYNKITTMHELNNNKNIGIKRTIITDSAENCLKFLAISDLHFGNKLERIDLINRAYNYCLKNKINIILCGGDLLDGSYTQGQQKISNLYKQIEYFIKNYPYDKNILTFSVAGDHDISVFKNTSINIVEICNNYRHDIIIGNYNNTSIILKNDQIILYHHINNGSLVKTKAPIILHGHSHKYATSLKNNTLNITIPSLSEINNPMPTVLELKLYFYKGYITNIIIKQIYFGTKDIILNESEFDIKKTKTRNNSSIKNTEKII